MTIIKVFNEVNPSVGYCPAIGAIIGVLLLHMNEEEAFTMLRRFIDKYEMSKLYRPGYPLLYCCYFIHDQLFQSWLPRLHSHFVSLYFYLICLINYLIILLTIFYFYFINIVYFRCLFVFALIILNILIKLYH